MCVSLKKYTVEDSRWGVSCMGFGDIFLGPRCVRGNDSNKLYLGTHPWSDITRIDWSTLPTTEEEAADCVNGSGYAMVKNPDPADRLHLRTEPTKSAASLGKYYTGHAGQSDPGAGRLGAGGCFWPSGMDDEKIPGLFRAVYHRPDHFPRIRRRGMEKRSPTFIRSLMKTPGRSKRLIG